jgi:hypothetical protein
MPNQKQHEIAVKIGTWINSRINKLEKPFLVLLILGVILNYSEIPQGNIISILSGIILALLYFLCAYAPPAEKDKVTGWAIFVNKLTYMGLSIAVVGEVFRINRIPGNEIMIQIGLFTILLSLLNILVYWIKRKFKEFFNIQFIIRVGIILILGIFLYFQPI